MFRSTLIALACLALIALLATMLDQPVLLTLAIVCVCAAVGWLLRRWLSPG